MEQTIFEIARELAGLSRKQAADLLQISEATITAYEHRRREPSLKRIGQMAEVYGIKRMTLADLAVTQALGEPILQRPDVIQMITQAENHRMAQQIKKIKNMEEFGRLAAYLGYIKDPKTTATKKLNKN